MRKKGAKILKDKSVWISDIAEVFLSISNFGYFTHISVVSYSTLLIKNAVNMCEEV